MELSIKNPQKTPVSTKASFYNRHIWGKKRGQEGPLSKSGWF
jgi:hypothetical protein